MAGVSLKGGGDEGQYKAQMEQEREMYEEGSLPEQPFGYQGNEDSDTRLSFGPLQAQTGEDEGGGSYQTEITDEEPDIDDEQFTLGDYEETEEARAVYTPGEAPEETPDRYDEEQDVDFEGGEALAMMAEGEFDEMEYTGDEGDDSEAYIGPPSGSTGRREVGQVGSSRDYDEAAGDQYQSGEEGLSHEEAMEMMDKALEAGYKQGKRQQEKGGELDSMEDLLKMHKVLDNSGMGEFKSIATAAYLVNQYRQGGQQPEEDDVLSEMRQELRDRYGGGGGESYEGAWRSILGEGHDEEVYDSLSDVNPGDASIGEMREKLTESGVSGDEANQVLAEYTTRSREGMTPEEDMREAYAGGDEEDVDYGQTEQTELDTGVEAETGEEGGGLFGRLKGYTGRLFGGDEEEGEYSDTEQAELTDTDSFGKGDDEGYESDEEREEAEQQIAEEEAREAAEDEGYSVDHIEAGREISDGQQGTAILDDGTEVKFVKNEEGIDLRGRENEGYSSAIEEYGSLDEELDRPGFLDRAGGAISGFTDYVGSAAENAGGYLSGLLGRGGGNEDEWSDDFQMEAGGDAVSTALDDTGGSKKGADKE